MPNATATISNNNELKHASNSSMDCGLQLHIILNQSKPKHFSLAETPARKNRSQLAAALDEMMASTQHNVEVSPKVIRCVNCQKSSSKKLAHLWLKNPCVRKPDTKVHHTHLVHLKSFRGIQYCGRCGGLAIQRVKKLKLPCPPRPSIAGQKVLNRITRGKLPFGMAHWPEQG